jgi:arylsulfatase A-like enzyme
MAGRPNILLILSDDHSAPHLGCYGDPHANTPNIDAFAAQGMRFDRAYTTSPQCMPSRASMFTGRSPVAISMTRFTAPLPREVPTILDALRDAGYFTGLGRRWHHLDGRANPKGVDGYVQEKYNLRTAKDRVDYLNVCTDKELKGETPRVLSEFLDQCPKDTPFFMYLGFNDPHRAWTLRPDEYRPDPASLVLPPHFPDTPTLREDLADYYGVLHRMDQEFAQAMDVLDKRGVRENTLVMFMGDNGAALLRGKGTLYEPSCHVPLIAQWPGKIAPGTVSDELISGEDIAATVLEAAGLDALEQITGNSFCELMTGGEHKSRTEVFTQRGAHGQDLPVSSAAFDLSRAIRTERYHLIYNAYWQVPFTPVDFYSKPVWIDLMERCKRGELSELHERLYFTPTRPMFELFDLQNDPYELTNLIDDPGLADVQADLIARLTEWMILERDFLPLPTGGN